jgi:hypothetical protein
MGHGVFDAAGDPLADGDPLAAGDGFGCDTSPNSLNGQ